MKVIEKTRCLSCDHISEKAVDITDKECTELIRFVTNCPHCKDAKTSLHKMLFEVDE